MIRTLILCVVTLSACLIWVDAGRSEDAPGHARFLVVRFDVPPPIPPGEKAIAPKDAPAPPIHGVTLEEFGKAFKPAPGNYEVWLLRPGCECPIKVCFTLPCGCPKVDVTCRQIVFDYGHCEKVKIRAGICSGFRVVYHNV